MISTRPAASLALLDASEQQIRDALVTYRALALSALDSLADAYAQIDMLTRQRNEARRDLARFTAAAVGVVPEAQP